MAHYKNTREAVLVQKSSIEALWRLCWYNRVLLEYSGDGAGTAECYTRTWENVLVQWYTIKSTWVSLLPHKLLQENSGSVGTEEYYKSTGETVLAE